MLAQKWDIVLVQKQDIVLAQRQHIVMGTGEAEGRARVYGSACVLWRCACLCDSCLVPFSASLEVLAHNIWRNLFGQIPKRAKVGIVGGLV